MAAPMHGIRVAWLSRVAAGIAACLGVAALLAAGPNATLLERARELHAVVEERWPPPPPDSVRAVLGGLFARAEREHDEAARAWLLNVRAELATDAGDVAARREAASAALAIPEARRDARLHWRLVRSLAWAASDGGDEAGAAAQGAAWAELVRAGAEERAAAELAYFRATRALRAGQRDSSEALLRDALERFGRVGDAERDIQCRTMLGILAGMGGRFGDARTHLREASDRARRQGRLSSLSNALVNLGTLERVEGRREAAAAVYAEAADVARRQSSPQRVADAMRGQVGIELDLGRLAVVSALAESIEAYGVRLGRPELRGAGRTFLAFAAGLDGRPADEVAIARAALAMGDSLPVQARMSLVNSALEGLALLGEHGALVALADSQRAVAEGAGVHHAAQLEAMRGQALFKLGRLADADAAAERALALLAGTGVRSHPYQIGARIVLGHVRLGEGRPAEAFAEYDQAEAGMLELRAGMSSSTAREHIAATTRELSGLLVRFALLADSGGAQRAFERFESVKARALHEQLRADSADAVTGTALEHGEFSLSAFRGEVLRDGEAYVAPYLGSDTAGVFVVTRDTFLVAPLRDIDGSARLRLRELGRALARRTTDPRQAAAVLEASRLVVRTLFADVLPALAGARRVLYSPEGPLHAVPGAMLAEALAEGGEGPEVAQVPSAAILRQLRARQAEPAPAAPRVLALTTSARVDSSLAGSAAEVDWLRTAYEPVSRVDGGAFAAEAEITRDWPRYDVIHFAGHTRIEDGRPWRSSLVLGATPDGGATLGVRAEDVLRLRLSARLAVLAACQSAGDRVVGSEGVAGLGAAFLGAGVPTVVATHWRVDDRVTLELMRAFYSELARGATVSAALRAAQRRVRSHAEWRHPYYWSGFTVLGDPDRRVKLHAQPLWRRVPWPPVLVALLVVVIAVLLRTRTRRPDASAHG